MPLTNEQKRIIDYIVMDMVDFPVASSDLTLLAKALNPLFYIVTPEKLAYYSVQGCYTYPQKYFQSLETHQPLALTLLGEVQEYIFYTLTAHFKIAAERAKMEFCELAWDYDEIIKIIPKHHYETPFISEPVHTEFSLLELPEIEQGIYSQQIVVSEQTAFLVADIHYLDGYTDSAALKLGEMPADFPSTEACFQFIDKLKKKAERKAMIYAAQCALMELVRNKVLSECSIIRAFRSESLKQLITLQFYYEAIKAKALPLTAIMDLSPLQTANLLNLALVSLIQHKICLLDVAKNMRAPEKKLATHHCYHALLMEKRIEVIDLMGVSELRAAFLCLPIVTYLIQNNKLHLHQAKNLPLHLKPLFCNSMYFTYFKGGPFDWNAFSNLERFHLSLLLNKNFAPLVLEKKLNISELANLSLFIFALLNEFPYLIDWLKEGLISPSDLMSAYLPEAFAYTHLSVYAQRLYAFFFESAYIINDKMDNLEKIIKEIIALEQKCDGAFTMGDVLQLLFMIIKNDIHKKINALNPHHSKTEIYHQFAKKITQAESSININWVEFLAEFLIFSLQVKTILSKQTYLARPKKSESYLTIQGLFTHTIPENNNISKINHRLYRSLNLDSDKRIRKWCGKILTMQVLYQLVSEEKIHTLETKLTL